MIAIIIVRTKTNLSIIIITILTPPPLSSNTSKTTLNLITRTFISKIIIRKSIINIFIYLLSKIKIPITRDIALSLSWNNRKRQLWRSWSILRLNLSTRNLMISIIPIARGSLENCKISIKSSLKIDQGIKGRGMNIVSLLIIREIKIGRR